MTPSPPRRATAGSGTTVMGVFGVVSQPAVAASEPAHGVVLFGKLKFTQP